MDPELILIFGFVLTLVIVATMTAHLIHRRVIRHEERKLELEARIEEAKASQVRTETAAGNKLEERVRVLERIATDGNHALAAQIEELRAIDSLDDARRPEAAQ